MSYYIYRQTVKMYKGYYIEHLQGTLTYKVYNPDEIMVACASTRREAMRLIDRITESKGE